MSFGVGWIEALSSGVESGLLFKMNFASSGEREEHYRVYDFKGFTDKRQTAAGPEIGNLSYLAYPLIPVVPIR